jgi:hypothetical protein
MAGPTQSEKQIHFVMGHLSIIRIFVIWGILESIIYLFTRGDRFKTLSVYLAIFFIITFAAYISPDVIDFL